MQISERQRNVDHMVGTYGNEQTRLGEFDIRAVFKDNPPRATVRTVQKKHIVSTIKECAIERTIYTQRRSEPQTWWKPVGYGVLTAGLGATIGGFYVAALAADEQKRKMPTAEEKSQLKTKQTVGSAIAGAGLAVILGGVLTMGKWMHPEPQIYPEKEIKKERFRGQSLNKCPATTNQTITARIQNEQVRVLSKGRIIREYVSNDQGEVEIQLADLPPSEAGFVFEARSARTSEPTFDRLAQLRLERNAEEQIAKLESQQQTCDPRRQKYLDDFAVELLDHLRSDLGGVFFRVEDKQFLTLPRHQVWQVSRPGQYTVIVIGMDVYAIGAQGRVFSNVLSSLGLAAQAYRLSKHRNKAGVFPDRHQIAPVPYRYFERMVDYSAVLGKEPTNLLTVDIKGMGCAVVLVLAQ